jgi:glutathionylspermidine synthase
MHSQEAQDKFIELRAQGWTLQHIATELHISKRTLVEWNHAFAADIQSCRAVEVELLKEKFLASRDEDLNRMARLKKDVDDELSNRTLKFVPIEKLFRIATELRQEIQESLQNNAGGPGVNSTNGTVAESRK